jgi:plastocyanin
VGKGLQLAALLSVASIAAQAAAAEHVVTMAGMNYRPAAIQAKLGDVIGFMNDDAVDHEVFVPTKGFGVDLGLQKPGQNTDLPLLRSGSFEVECVIHPNMLLKVTVRE